MTPVLIIGYGNPLRSDDGIGWRAAQDLVSEWPSSRVRVEAAHQLLPEMADWIGEAGCVVFIDACWDAIPGRIRTRAVHPERTGALPMTHQFSPQGLLADAEHLFHHSPEAFVVSVGGASFEHGEELSPQVEAVYAGLLAQAKRIVQKCLAKSDCHKVEIHA